MMNAKSAQERFRAIREEAARISALITERMVEHIEEASQRTVMSLGIDNLTVNVFFTNACDNPENISLKFIYSQTAERLRMKGYTVTAIEHREPCFVVAWGDASKGHALQMKNIAMNIISEQKLCGMVDKALLQGQASFEANLTETEAKYVENQGYSVHRLNRADSIYKVSF
jgi:hypothetical protein